MPNATIFLKPMVKAINKKLIEIPQRGMQRLQVIGKTIKETIEPMIPPILARLDYATSRFKDEYVVMNNIVEAAISDIHFRTLSAAKTFDDINDKFGSDREIITNIACLFLFLVSSMRSIGTLNRN